MFNLITEINWIAVILAALTSSILGGLWFTVFFGRLYAEALGKEYTPKEKPAPIFIVGPFVCGFVSTVASAILIYALKIESVSNALIFGSIVGIGYLASTTVNTAINPNIPRPLFYGLISGSYFFLSSLIVAVIICLIR
ncbi:DUF1761 domain-containing protein [Leptospira ilyithenensis]|uniref:DUF1761 domain-containing protein n=1 Tax=Leptospira ilyithenensis TaxID=2484901 RepID=A0A4R9LP22_9LEPT|nr:DUF1761 domain-containing protein [Leptospira ilyithenensis]TGN09680.1 DUF1761 domain-containing protein [Leptospira ilyithenensis]